MKAQLRQLLAELETWGHANDARESELSRRMLNLEPETAQLLSLLVQSSQRKSLLEVGTSNGYSTLWLAWCAQQNDGHLTSIDINPAKHELAAQNLIRAGLSEWVTLRMGDAAEVIGQLDGPFDFVFLDADRHQYPALLDLLLPRLTSHALILADNAQSHPEEIAPYLQLIENHPEFSHLVVSVGKGLSIAYRDGD